MQSSLRKEYSAKETIIALMQPYSLFYRWAVIFLVSVLFPPLGIFLVWMRPETRLSRRIVNSFIILIIGFFYLKFFFGMRVEVDGTGASPVISFYKKGRHDALLERNRAEQKQKASISLPLETQLQSAPFGSATDTKALSTGKTTAPPVTTSN